MKDDRQLLDEYVRDGTESVFAQIVSANVGMVYSVCRRILADEHLAEDATQAVFFLLARKVRSLHRDVVLSGWLHTAARNVCANVRRSEMIRRRHEMKAARESEAAKASADESVLDQSLIDEALGRLRDVERDPVLLRFFQGLSFAQVATVLRISEDAAKKRTERALDRLRELLTPAGGTVMSATALGAVLTSCSHATPPTLAVTATAAAIHGVVPKTLALALKGAIGMSAATKTQLGVAVVVVAILLGTGAVLMTMSMDGKKTQTVAVGEQQTSSNPPLKAIVDASASIQPQLPKIPDWIPGGNTPMLMARRPGERRGLFFTIQAEHFDSKQGGKMVAPGLSNLGGGDWVCYRRVDFDEGANLFVANLAAGEVDPASAIEVRLDSPTAPSIAVLKIQKTPAWSAFQTQSTPIQGATGVHDVYLTFTGGARVADLDWIKFVRTPREAASQIAGNSYDDAHGVHDHDGVIANIDRGDFLKYSQLDFGQGLESFEACIGVGDRYSNGQPANTHGQIEIRVDSIDGPVIGMLITQSTGAFTTHVPQSTPISKTSGIHDVYLTFRTNAVCDLEWFTFK